MNTHPEILARFGRDPKMVFERDGWKCLICGSVDDLTVDHIDGNGRHSATPNNDMGNLRTLCRKCHGSVDGKKGGGKVGKPSGMSGKHHSKEARGRMSIAGRNREPISEETRRKMSVALMGHKRNLGRHASEKARRNMSMASTKRWKNYHDFKGGDIL